MTVFDRYLHAITVRGEHEAREDRSATIEAHHLLLAIAAEQESTTCQALASAGLDHQALREALDREFEHSLSLVGVSRNAHDVPRPGKALEPPKMGASAKLALERSFSSVARKKELRPAHLLLGILQAQAGTVPRALALAGIDPADLALNVRQTLTDSNE
ncbi:Clp protease N-terminal domain-containing protein [Streptomyces sp. NPDC017993]|uniref:Clp protease N-terminal domain-containing protein n=1 Tax=Streptomyces sp. NPDC017993 TaxID=3365027 RepID=UPI0037B5E472